VRRERDRRTRGNENIHVEGEKFVDKRRNARRISVGVALFEQEIPPNNVSQICEAPT
jgi:hypothetical protein